MIPVRLQIAALVAAAFIAGLIGWRQAGIRTALAEARGREIEDRLRAVLKAKEIEDEVEALPPDVLLARARRWVRGRR